MGSTYSLPQYIDDLRLICAETDDEDEIFRRLGPLALRLVSERSWLQPKYYESDESQGFGVHLLSQARYTRSSALFDTLPRLSSASTK